MKKWQVCLVAMAIFAFALFLVLGTKAHAGPFMVCDAQTGVTSYKLTGPAWLPTTIPAQADGSLRVDVATALVGANNVTLAACKNDPLWGEQCTSAVPFAFTRPSPPANPGGVKLIP